MGIKEQIIFTEINFDEIKRVRGFNITFVTSTNNKEETKALLKAIGLPIVRK
jgi:large subunit ribosomal protein L5